ncbi:unnamed protein product [Calypogeia fissa]
MLGVHGDGKSLNFGLQGIFGRSSRALTKFLTYYGKASWLVISHCVRADRLKAKRSLTLEFSTCMST